MTEVNTPYIKAAIYHSNCFSRKERSLSISGPKRTKDLQVFLELHQAFLSTMPSLGWDLKKTTANQSVKFIDVEFLRLATGWILSRTIPHVGGESEPREREEGERDSRFLCSNKSILIIMEQRTTALRLHHLQTIFPRVGSSWKLK